ncbi:hypothetical protein K461DRAFT_293045 [Myriangium duriaei CBS 260.36]|uniref:Uncharacterized protein n=1 Tax=Myriangium duriaei CBS 260.36 TaxID=1168546 RepID=A0A9P4MH60_9PEZI|nr:hypothetical protein K461DRAFT_293045 [Myriangium duriaei CBS 260.36]
MGEGAPYLYTPSVGHGGGFDFNPRAYSQATYAASLEQQSPKPKQQGPLIDLNRHPDSWMMVTPNLSGAEPMPASTRTKIVTCRWIQFGLRVIELFGAIGLFVCVISFQGVQQTQSWILRIPPAYDAMLNIYGIYHLVRPVHKRPAGSSASYNFFAFCMDGGLIPFYIFTSFYSYTNYKQAPGTDGRWRTFFTAPGAADLVLESAWLGSIALAGLHALSIVFDLLLLFWFRKISNLPPDMSPLDAAARLRSKHKHKNSEMSFSTMDSDPKKMYRVSTHSMSDSDTLTNGHTIPEPTSRQVPFLRSRVEGEKFYSPHTRESARLARGAPNSPDRFSFQSRSTRASMVAAQDDVDKHSPYAGHSFPFPPGQDRVSFNASRPGTADRPNTATSAPQAAQDPREAKQAQSQSLLRDNWYVYDDSSDLGTPRRGMSPAPPAVPAKNEQQYLGPYDAVDKENAGGVRRMLTVSSSVYSDDGAASISSGHTARPSKYYGDLAVAQQAVRYNGGSPTLSGPEPMGKSYGNRVVSRTGVDLADEPRQRNVSGKAAEEGRGFSFWERRAGA